ncbi:replication factor-a protein [Pelomyxa schiedti]|nr:replication factor-a protein [Pelomyxa schiedti]
MNGVSGHSKPCTCTILDEESPMLVASHDAPRYGNSLPFKRQASCGFRGSKKTKRAMYPIQSVGWGSMDTEEPARHPLVNLAELQDLFRTESPTTEEPHCYKVIGTVTLVRHDANSFYYLACPFSNCNRKVVSAGVNYHCEMCGKTFDEPSYRYILSLTVSDDTGSVICSCFNDVGEKILGHKCKVVVQMQQNTDPIFETIFQEITNRKFVFVIKARRETFQGETRVKYTAIQADSFENNT